MRGKGKGSSSAVVLQKPEVYGKRYRRRIYAESIRYIVLFDNKEMEFYSFPLTQSYKNKVLLKKSGKNLH